ncbi:MAG: hypothetical protein HQK96_20425 [Nitrospirae bacterium]|nr:hypothetical protein [Nitrospirota bacterium]
MKIPLSLKKINIDLLSLSEFKNEDIDNFIKNYDYSKHVDRGQRDIDRQKGQNKDGKDAELATAAFFIQKGYETTRPDFKLYPKEKKSFIPDLFISKKPILNIPVHVKSTNPITAAAYDMSWTFQYADVNGRMDTGDHDKYIFDFPESKDRLVCCLVSGNVVSILAMTEIWVLHKYNLFKPSKKYPTSKRVIYLCDL